MKKLMIALLGAAIAACSSKPTETKTSEAPAPWDKPAASAPKTEAPPEPAAAPVAPAASPEKNPMTELNAALKAGNDEQIQKSAQQYLVQVPSDAKALNALAMSQYKKGRFDFALYLLGKAVAAEPGGSELYSNIGLVELAKGNRRAAIQNFRRAIELDSNNGIAAANLGSIYVQERDYIKAAVVLEMAHRRGMRDLKILSNYGVALAHSGHPEKANDLYQVALKEQPNNKEVLLNASILLIDHLNKPKEGLDLLSRLKFLGPSPESKARIIALENKAKAGVK